MEEGVARDFTANLVYTEDVSNIKGLPEKVILTTDLDDNGDGTFTVYDIIDEDMG